MTVRYFAGLFLTVIFLVFFCLSSGLKLYAGMFIDVSSIIIIIVFPLLFMGVLLGWKNVGTVFSVLSNKNLNKEALLYAKKFFENYGKTVFSIAFIAFVISFMEIIGAVENYAALGPNIKFASIVLVYAGIINMIVIMPYKLIIDRKIMEKG